MLELLLLLLPVAASSGWLAAKQHYHKEKNAPLHKHYFTGLNFLLNEQPDKAVEVFIKLLEVNTDTVEMHFALGNLFRKKGEVERYIRIHQNLIARPQLSKTQRSQALHALAKDYLSAGVLDRSERLFLDALEENNHDIESMYYLLDIYQQEKNWEQAIELAQKIQSSTGKSKHIEIAHYYCELAEKKIQSNELGAAKLFLKRAINIDKKSARALLIKAKIEDNLGNHEQAIEILKKIKEDNADYFSESIPSLISYHHHLQTEKELYSFLEKSIENCPRISSAIALTTHLQTQDFQKAKQFLADYLKQHPSLRGLFHLIELQFNIATALEKENLQLLHLLLKQLLTKSPTYLCHQCGFSGKTLLWLCPSCKQWNTTKPILGLEGE